MLYSCRVYTTENRWLIQHQHVNIFIGGNQIFPYIFLNFVVEEFLSEFQKLSRKFKVSILTIFQTKQI